MVLRRSGLQVGRSVALIAAMCGAGIVIQIVLFLVVSLVLLFFTRPFAVRFLNKDTLKKRNVDRVVGMEGVVTEGNLPILGGTGKVSLGGNIWTARTENEGGTIPWTQSLRAPCGRRQADCKGQRKEGGNET